jgi:hypothetical protein
VEFQIGVSIGPGLITLSGILRSLSSIVQVARERADGRLCAAISSETRNAGLRRV